MVEEEVEQVEVVVGGEEKEGERRREGVRIS